MSRYVPNQAQRHQYSNYLPPDAKMCFILACGLKAMQVTASLCGLMVVMRAVEPLSKIFCGSKILTDPSAMPPAIKPWGYAFEGLPHAIQLNC